MEIIVPSTDEFRFDSAASTPFVSAPSSPKSIRSDSFNHYSNYPFYRSAPTSPTSSIPFAWEDTPGTPRSAKPSRKVHHDDDNDDDDDADCGFAFQFNGPVTPDSATTAADQLFEMGRIRPLKPPPAGLHAPQSLKSSPNRRFRHGKGNDDFDPFTAAMVISSRTRKGSLSRSLSPSPIRGDSQRSCNSAASGGRKWRLRDWFLFRSSSEGRVVGNRNYKEPVPKYIRKVEDSSFRSTDGGGSGGGIGSVHEMHYKSSRAVSEEMKKKTTALPFHGHGLFGCFRFNPAVSRIARRFS